MTDSPIIRHFDAAAPRYDEAATAQKQIAERLVAWAAESGIHPASILDIGAGTGLVTAAAHRRWPNASLTALDAAPAMLAEARRKVPSLTTITGDVLTTEPPQRYDALFSSMVLHWLPDPRAVLRRWQSWLKPEGRLFVALPVEGSFQSWRDLCRDHGIRDGLWPLPPAAFADDLAERAQHEDITVTYPSPRAFLHALKKTGAATPRAGHRPEGVGRMRGVVSGPTQEVLTLYQLVFLDLQARVDS